ncbi:hypothetical protein Slin15195_G120710 [Septoria linicola]|uniref:Uncharacterized protein n=1 Tax=Septoria linicola TaxID=215465 RepID=A0A9Q9B7K0_9PEZI|nr:hypothetical protein Slin15195_G120710 [Septoria linicola]
MPRLRPIEQQPAPVVAPVHATAVVSKAPKRPLDAARIEAIRLSLLAPQRAAAKVAREVAPPGTPVPYISKVGTVASGNIHPWGTREWQLFELDQLQKQCDGITYQKQLREMEEWTKGKVKLGGTAARKDAGPAQAGPSPTKNGGTAQANNAGPSQTKDGGADQTKDGDTVHVRFAELPERKVVKQGYPMERTKKHFPKRGKGKILSDVPEENSTEEQRMEEQSKED